MMKTFVIYEIWTRSTTVQAASEDDALAGHRPPETPTGLSLSNWHAIEVPTTAVRPLRRIAR